MVTVRRSKRCFRFLCRGSVYPLIIILTLFVVGWLLATDFRLIASRNSEIRVNIPKYLTSSFDKGMSGGLGNNLFELISTIGIARYLKRIPFYYVNQLNATKIIEGRIRTFFPKIEEQFLKVSENLSTWHYYSPFGKMYKTEVPFHAGDCCKYSDPTILVNRAEEYLELQGAYFQSFKYFHDIRDSVREWLVPPKDVMKRAAKRIPQKCSGKIGVCTHVRRGDFMKGTYHLPSLSTASFTFNTTMNLIEKYSKKGEVCSMVFGNDVEWTKEVFKDHSEVLVIEGSTPEEDLALSRQFCDVFLITAPASTFGFWLGYLVKPGAQVYYKSIMNSTEGVLIQMNPEDFFLPDWISLEDFLV